MLIGTVIKDFLCYSSDVRGLMSQVISSSTSPAGPRCAPAPHPRPPWATCIGITWASLSTWGGRGFGLHDNHLSSALFVNKDDGDLHSARRPRGFRGKEVLVGGRRVRALTRGESAAAVLDSSSVECPTRPSRAPPEAMDPRRTRSRAHRGPWAAARPDAASPRRRKSPQHSL